MANTEVILQRLNKAISVMENQVRQGQTVSVAQLSEAAAMSKYHFHRVYRLLLGETCAQTLSRLQLAIAGTALTRPQASITHIALESGFSSAQALAKALRRELHCNATDLRTDPERLSAILGSLQLPKPLNQSPYQIYLESLPPVPQLIIVTRGQYPNLNQTYWQLFGMLPEPDWVGAITGNAEDDVDSDVSSPVFACGVILKHPLAAIPAPAEMRQYSAQQWLVVRHLGSYQHLADTVDYLYFYVLTQPRLQLSDTPCLYHYLDDPEAVAEDNLRTDIYLPVTADGL